MMIRPAQFEDYAEVVRFWNVVIRETTISFSDEEKTIDGLHDMITERRARGYEFLVAADEKPVGLATYSQFRDGNNGYRHAMEHTIILAPDARGHGVGRRLMHWIETHARVAGHHAMIAAVSGENASGIAFHAAIGYREIARIPEVGWKFNRWLDLVLMQKML
jgi:phosphinothricin acetyltransferase